MFKKVIENAKFTDQSQKVIQCTINGQECFVPADESNTDYQAILKWQTEGGVVEQAEVQHDAEK